MEKAAKLPNPVARAQEEREARAQYEAKMATSPLANRPVLPESCALPWLCWMELTGQRPRIVAVGMSAVINQIGLIPYVAFSAWCRDRDIYGPRLEELWRAVIAMDTHYVQMTNRGKAADE